MARKLPKNVENEDIEGSLEYEDMSSSSEFSSGSDSMTMVKVNRVYFDKKSDEYRLRRDRNNRAVRKSREKTRILIKQKEKIIKDLLESKRSLETKIMIKRKELNFLSELCLGTIKNGQRDDNDVSFYDNNNNNAKNNDVEK